MVRQSQLHLVLADAGRFGFSRLDGGLFGFVPEPPTSPVRCLMQRDTVNPGLQAGFPVKVFHSPKHLQEHFLCGIRRIRRIVHYPVHQSIYRLLELSN